MEYLDFGEGPGKCSKKKNKEYCSEYNQEWMKCLDFEAGSGKCSSKQKTNTSTTYIIFRSFFLQLFF